MSIVAMKRETVSLCIRVLLALAVLLLAVQSAAWATILNVTARNDKPGPVEIQVDATDPAGSVVSAVLTWGGNDNSFSTQSMVIPSSTNNLRLTFINDQFVCCNPDTDRNAHIDFFTLDGSLREAESFDTTGGTDPNFPGCEVGTVDTRTVATCGNQNDFVEYQVAINGLFWKEPFPNYSPSGIPDFDQKQDQWAHEVLCGLDQKPTTSPVGDDQPIPFNPLPDGRCPSADTPIIDKGLDGIMETVLNDLDPVAGDDIYRYDYCVPTSVANCLWWFDSKFELEQGQPPCDPTNPRDTYDMVTGYPLPGTPLLRDDHCRDNVDDPQTPPGGHAQPDPTTAFGELIEDLAWRMDTGGQRTGNIRHGTNVFDMEAAVRLYLSERGLTDEFIVNLVRNPSFDFIVREVERSQNVILALSFIQDCSGAPVFVGGHAVTTAGVFSDPADPSRAELCLSDPFYDLAEVGSTGRVLPGLHPHPPVPPDPTHNDASFVSHDCNPVKAGSPFPPFGGVLLPQYGTIVGEGEPRETNCRDIANFFGQNRWDPNDPAFGDGIACEEATAPICGGVCPERLECQTFTDPTGLELCQCVPAEFLCEESQAPLCGGSCPFGEECRSFIDPGGQELCGCEPAPCDVNCPIRTVVSYALEISPFFWKTDFPDYAPSGMPDFDQKQSRFMCPIDQSWSYCGPTAVADSFWWFDSKFEIPPGLPDDYKLVESLDPAFNHHDAGNVELLIDALGDIMNTDNRRGVRPAPYCGTYVDDMADGIFKWLANAGLEKEFFVNVVRAPSFDFVAEEVEKSQDVVLLLGFWQFQEELGRWVRIGGHYVTVAGVDREGRLIAFSDPFLDAAESGATGGRVLGATPHPHPAAPPDTIHNDAQNVSHDMYEAVTTGSPGGIWGPKDYAAVLGPGGLDNFFGQNTSDELVEEEHPVLPPSPGPEPIITEVDYALEVSPCPEDGDGDGFRPICDGDCDDTNPDVYPGAPELCDNLDNDCNDVVDDTVPVPTTCGVGACEGNTGEIICVGGMEVDTCDPLAGATPEVCDNIDNDCDGDTDEGLPQDDPTLVRATRQPGITDITLDWIDGQTPFSVYRSTDPATVVDPANLVGTPSLPTFTDALVPGEGQVQFYKVKGSCVPVPPS